MKSVMAYLASWKTLSGEEMSSNQTIVSDLKQVLHIFDCGNTHWFPVQAKRTLLEDRWRRHYKKKKESDVFRLREKRFTFLR